MNSISVGSALQAPLLDREVVEVAVREEEEGRGGENNDDDRRQQEEVQQGRELVENQQEFFTVGERLSLEWMIFKSQALVLLFLLAFLVYGPLMVYRNVAFYRFKPGPRLKDIGYEIFDEAQDGSFVAVLNLFPMNLIIFLATSMLFATLFHNTKRSENSMDSVTMSTASSPVNSAGTATSTNAICKPFITNILRRGLVMLLVGHTLRFMTYSVTSLPGTARHCFPGEVENLHPGQPKNAHDIFTRFALSPGQNCGDLMFSGHMLQIMTPVLLWRMYAVECFEGILSSNTVHILERVMWTTVLIQAILIIALRNHYTADVIVGSYTTPLLWHFLNGAVLSKDRTYGK